MLSTLSIRDVVLIDRLDLEFGSGLGVLTGETGAGKSILLDALGLALGQRAEQRLVRHGTERAVVTAAFDLTADHPVFNILAEHGLADGTDTILLRRVLGNDGRSRAYINDQPVSVSLLRTIGDGLVDIHGQFDSHRLLNSSTHRHLLDAFGGLAGLATSVAATWESWRSATSAREEAERALEEARRDEDYLRHAVDELDKMAPQPGEDAQLSERRQLMMHSEKLIDAIGKALKGLNAGRDSAEETLRKALRHLDGVAEKAEGRLNSAIGALDRAANELADGVDLLERAARELDLDPQSMDEVEERLFALRALARKHKVAVDDLAIAHQRMSEQLAEVDDGGKAVAGLRIAETAAREQYVTIARELYEARTRAGQKMDALIERELIPLKLENARLTTMVETIDEAAWGPSGIEKVAFLVSTNPGAPPGPLDKIASGGELARFMLALKVVLAKADPVPTLVFDEVDSGIGGAVADAVGERLAKMANDAQVLVVTHSPQVAARGIYHWRVSKSGSDDGVLTTITVLDNTERKEEVARMLAGAEVTDEARAAAERLIQGNGV